MSSFWSLCSISDSGTFHVIGRIWVLKLQSLILWSQAVFSYFRPDLLIKYIYKKSDAEFCSSYILSFSSHFIVEQAYTNVSLITESVTDSVVIGFSFRILALLSFWVAVVVSIVK